MIYRLIHGLVISLAIVAPAAIIQPGILSYPHTWILLCTGILASVFQPSYKAFEKSRTNEDRGTAVQIVWSIYVTQLAALIEAGYFRYPASFRFDFISIVALNFMLIGLGLRTWAVYVLGKFFTWNIEVKNDQKVVEVGPYRLIRHPSYAGAFLTYVSSAVFLHAWISAVISVVVLMAAFLRRIRHEEALLKKNLPSYESYCTRTKALVPFFI